MFENIVKVICYFFDKYKANEELCTFYFKKIQELENEIRELKNEKV